ncbi:MAG TPA: PKD domain-containing protein [Draconibacterium sp.]|nr:PKD domain-containing protein [Draconibacterium sp.]
MQTKLITKLILILAVYLFCAGHIVAQEDKLCRKSTEGKDFWFGFMESRNYNPDHFLEITVTASETTTFQITIGKEETPFNRRYTVFADSSVQVKIPWQIVEATGSEQIQNKGIHLTAQNPVNVYALNWDQNSADVAVIYPVESLGYEYFAMCYRPNIDLANPTSGNSRNSEFLIVATYDSTKIEITPSKVTDQLKPNDSTFVIYLNRGEVYQVQSENDVGSANFGQGDLTGSHVFANKPIAFYSGSLSTTIPFGVCCPDHLYEQIPPVQSWGREFFSVPLKTREQDRYRILASEDNTNVQITGLQLFTLNRGEFKELIFFYDEPKRIFSDKPVLVAQFSQSRGADRDFTNGNGDPFMIILSSTSQSKNEVTFVAYESPKIITQDTTYVGIKKYYVNIVSLTTEIPNILFDGISIQNEFVPFVEKNYSYTQKEIVSGTHRIENKKGGFLAYVYGFGGIESYGYGVGFNLDLVLDLGENIEFFEGDTLLLCGGDTLVLDAGSYFDHYSWNTGQTSQSIVVTEPGEYAVKTSTDEGCVLYDTVYVFESYATTEIGERFDEGCYPYALQLKGNDGFETYVWQNEFNDTLSVNQSIIADTTGVYRLTVYNNYQCSARDTVTLTVFPVPEIELQGDHLICGRDSTRLLVSVTDVPDSLWNFAGSYTWMTNSEKVFISEENRTSANIKVTDWGDFEIYYRLRTIDNCETTDTFKVRFHPQPVSDFTFDDDAICEGYSKKITFTGTATDSAYFDWNLDGCRFVDTIDIQERIYNISVGAFLQTLPQISLAINDNGCFSDTIVKPLSAKPNFTMKADNSRGCDSLSVYFTSELLTPDDVDFAWTFDDSEIIRQQNLTKNYPKTGFYKVNLTITNPVTQCINSYTIDSMIKVFPTPIAAITADPFFCYKDSALLIYTHHIDSSFCIWENSGRVWSGFKYDSIIMNIYHPVESVKLTVNEYGCESKSIDMNLKRKPNFDFTVDKEEGCQPYVVEAFAHTGDPEIEFGWVTDSLIYSGLSHIYFFPDTGRFDMELVATSGETGCVDTLLKPDWIWVHRNPYSKFEVDFQVALIENSTITFTNYSERADKYFWDFGDSITSEEFETVHTYKQLGEYTARLYAESEFGCVDTFELDIKIIPSTVYAPNAFRPDSDIPENRTFMPVEAGADETRFNLKIYNRWGDLVFESNSLFYPWDGTLKNGGDAPMGNYVWISNYFDIQGFEHNEKGQILLIR